MTVAMSKSVARGTKVGGIALALAGALVGAYLLLPAEGLWPISRFFRVRLRNMMVPRPKESSRMANLPHIYFWAWERPEDLQFLKDRKVGVAFLAKTIYLPLPLSENPSSTSPAAIMGYDEVNIRPRLQPLRITPGTPLMGVVRIETFRGNQ